jgi:hypothetical protein
MYADAESGTIRADTEQTKRTKTFDETQDNKVSKQIRKRKLSFQLDQCILKSASDDGT